ncbi:DNA-3-methyladenine glycosylase [Enterococcus canis]|uniref:Putative 3-methyladenine DNA glycosylase n=2 Tax=Enterococcus canis TaxID=214095 RepID=A0A1L8RGG0_9ENTE|nr:DNA-3-methyladenine glycosylase [Enterococcus canis]
MKQMNEMKEFFQQATTPELAEYLLGMYLEHETPMGKLGGYIVDCEDYLGPDDEAAHSFGMRQTKRVQAMYGPPGTIYLYTMHTHLILNIIAREAGLPQGVMLRGFEPVAGLALMEENRGGRKGPEVSNGPGKLVAALAVTKDFYGQSIFDSRLHLVPEKRRYPQVVEKLPRVGIPNKGQWTDMPLRYTVKGNPYVTGQRKQAYLPNNGWRDEDENGFSIISRNK